MLAFRANHNLCRIARQQIISTESRICSAVLRVYKIIRKIMTGSLNSMVSNRNRDCFACRLVSGAGLIGAGLYVSHHSKKFNKQTGKTMMFSIASVLVLLGSARILDLPPFRKQFNHE